MKKMFQFSFRCWSFVAGLVSCSAVLPQEIDCGGSDYRCLQLIYESSCAKSSATRESCADFLERLEADEKSGEVDWLLIRGATLLALSDKETAVPRKGDYRARARAALEVVLGIDPSNTEAFMGLAALSEGVDRTQYLGEALATDPGNNFALQGLVSELAASGGKDDLEKAAALTKDAYLKLEPGEQKWHLAASAYSLLLKADTEEASRFRIIVEQDAGSERLPQVLSELEVDELRKILSAVCNVEIIRVLSVNRCPESIRLSFENFSDVQEQLDTKIRMDFAEVITQALIEATSGYIPTGSPSPPYDSYMEYADFLVSLGLPSSIIYQMQASLTRGDEQLTMMRRAIEFDDGNGQLYYRLALMHFERAEWASAIENFAIAKPLLPAWRHPVLEQFVREAEIARARQ